MTFSAADHAEAVDLIAATPFERERWPEVLALLAKAGGGWCTQVLGWDPVAQCATLNFADGGLEDLMEGWVEYGGLDIARNPRARHWMLPPNLEVFGENRFSTEAERNRYPIYADWFRLVDTPYSASAILDRLQGVTVGVAVIRGHSQGDADEEAALHLGALMPHLRSALRLRAKLDDEAAALAVGALEALRSTTFLCDRLGRVVGATASAEEVARQMSLLRVRSGRLQACDAASDRDLQEAIQRAAVCFKADMDGPPQSSVILRSVADGRPSIADVAPIPAAPFSLRLGGVVLVSIRASGPKRPLHLLKRAYGLTDAEADVAQRLAAGARIADVATERGVSSETVRNQVKALFAKMDVNSQTALAGAVNGLIGHQD